MSEPNVIRCLQCKRTFNRDSEGAQDYLDHRETCPDSYTGYMSDPANWISKEDNREM